VRALVKRYPVICFFLLAYGVSWLAWLPYVLSTSGLGLEPDLHIPALLGSTQLVGVLPGAYLGPVAAAFLVTALADGRAGLRRWAHRLFHVRVSWRWYVGVLLAVPAAVLLATATLPAAWGHVHLPNLTIVLVSYLPVLVLQIVTTGVAEEPGWRDFALPRMQRRFGPVLGTTVLGVLWGCWHLPLFLTEWGGWPHVAWWQPVEFVAACVPLSFVITWVFNRTGQSLPVVLLLHASINTTYSSIWVQLFPTLNERQDAMHAQLLAGTVLGLVVLAATRGRLGYDAQKHGVSGNAPIPSGHELAYRG
jgi:membrane protease YdiL (CAAX protease family)